MSFENKRVTDVNISSQLTSDLNIDTPQKVDISALKLKIIKKEKKETIKNRVINFTILIGLGTIAYFISN